MTATKKFRVGKRLAGIAMKSPCIAVTSSNITLAGEQTISSIDVVAGDRVLVKDQTDQIKNGVYVVSTSAWQRADDFDGNNNVLNGTFVIVAIVGSGDFWAVGFWAVGFWATGFWQGTTVTLYSLSSSDPIIIGTSPLAFNQVVI